MIEPYNEMSAGTLLEYMGMDANKWTDAFLHMTDLGNAGPDFRDTVRGWFANALGAGESAGWARAKRDDPGINELAQHSNDTAHAKGWWESDRNFGEVIALIHSEASEALEEWRDGHPVDERYYSVAKYRPAVETLPNDGELGYIRDWATTLDGLGDGGVVDSEDIPERVALALCKVGFLKPEGVPAELADIFIRVGDTATQYGIDLNQEVLLKQDYNATRPHRHGGKLA